MLSAALFAQVQRAAFYRELVDDALDTLPDADGASLIDVGCGPGLLARRAAIRGYAALGVDADRAMVTVARVLARRSGAAFRRASAIDVARAGNGYSVVAASSLLAVVPDPVATCAALWSAVSPGGTLLVIEPNERMTVAAARQLFNSGSLGPGAGYLLRWARAREGRTVGLAPLEPLTFVANVRHAEALHGLVTVSSLRREGSTSHQDRHARRPSPATAQPGSPLSRGKQWWPRRRAARPRR